MKKMLNEEIKRKNLLWIIPFAFVLGILVTQIKPIMIFQQVDYLHCKNVTEKWVVDESKKEYSPAYMSSFNNAQATAGRYNNQAKEDGRPETCYAKLISNRVYCKMIKKVFVCNSSPT